MVVVSLVGQEQTPDWHVLPPPQAFPQEPQLELSVCRFLHVPLQSVWPEGQTQLPEEQNLPP